MVVRVAGLGSHEWSPCLLANPGVLPESWKSRSENALVPQSPESVLEEVSHPLKRKKRTTLWRVVPNVQVGPPPAVEGSPEPKWDDPSPRTPKRCGPPRSQKRPGLSGHCEFALL